MEEGTGEIAVGPAAAVVEGHVPIGALLRILTERPSIKGISLPGMSAGSPGMFGEKTAPFTT